MPRQALWLPVCDHYSGVELRMRKSLALQADMLAELGACVFDVTLDCEDGAHGGGRGRTCRHGRRDAAADERARVAVRVHPVDHPAFFNDMATIAAQAGHRLCHIMGTQGQIGARRQSGRKGTAARMPGMRLHVLIESPAAVPRVRDRSPPRVQSLSFGLMDFVSRAVAPSLRTAWVLQGGCTLWWCGPTGNFGCLPCARARCHPIAW